MPKFGAASALFGIGNYLTVPNNGDFNYGTGSFTVDAWVFLNRANIYQHIISTDTSGKFMLSLFNTNISLGRHNIAWDTNIPHGISPGVWTHIALVRDNGNISYYKNGVLISIVPNSIDYTASSNVFIGAHPGETHLEGLMDELRISKGVARWTSNFTPPTSEY